MPLHLPSADALLMHTNLLILLLQHASNLHAVQATGEEDGAKDGEGEGEGEGAMEVDGAAAAKAEAQRKAAQAAIDDDPLLSLKDSQECTPLHLAVINGGGVRWWFLMECGS